MNNSENKNPLHGITLQTILGQLEKHYGFEEMSKNVNIKCFNENPSLKSSLTFLRKTEWARKKVEALYIRMIKNQSKL